MTRKPTLGEWITAKFGDQGVLAAKVKPPVAKNTVSSWVTGRNRVKPVYRKQLEAMGFEGEYPDEASAVAEPAPGYVTRETYDELRQELWKMQGRLERLENAFEKLGEGVRLLALEREERRAQARG